MPDIHKQYHIFEFLLFLLGSLLALSSLYFGGLFFWLPEVSIEEILNFIERFQILISGILAFAAGIFVWLSAKIQIKHKKESLDNEKINSQIYLATSILAECRVYLEEVERLEIIDFFQQLYKRAKAYEGPLNKFEYKGRYIIIEDGFLAIYKGNIDRLGILKPGICEDIVRNANAVRACIMQINQIARYFAENKKTNADRAIDEISFCLKTSKNAFKSLNSIIVILEEYISKLKSEIR